METPSLAELKQKNPFCREHLNLSFQSIIYKNHREIFEAMKAEGARIDAEMDRRAKDTETSWRCLASRYPQIRGELERLRRLVGG